MPTKNGRKVLRAGQSPVRKMNASRQAAAKPQLVRNVKTGEIAQYIPDRLQPSIPKGWVPTNSSRKSPARKSASTAFVKDGSLMVQRRGDEYRILNSSRKVVARGRLNASVGNEDVFLDVQADLADMGYQLEEEEGGDGWVLYDERGSHLGSWDSNDLAQFFEMAANFNGDPADAIITYILDDVAGSQSINDEDF